MMTLSALLLAAVATGQAEVNPTDRPEAAPISYEFRFATVPYDITADVGIVWDEARVPLVEPLLAARNSKFPINEAEPSAKTRLRRVTDTSDREVLVVSAILEDEADCASLVKAIQTSTRANVMFAPRVAAVAGQLWTLEDVTAQPFVMGVTVGRSDPRVDQVFSGFQIRAVDSEQGDSNLHLTIVRQDVDGVDVVDLPASLGPGTTLQDPHVVNTTVEVATGLEPNQSLLIGIRTRSEEVVDRGLFAKEETVTEWEYIIGTKREPVESK